MLAFFFSCSMFALDTPDTLFYKKELRKVGLTNIETIYNKQQATRLLKYWKSIYPDNKVKMYDFLSHYRWEKILNFQYKNAVKNNEKYLAIQFSFCLAIVYHRQTKYDDAMPFLAHAIKNKAFLTEKQFEDLLNRQEACFRAIGKFDKAVIVRKKRIVNGFSTNFSELYSAVGMHLEALSEFKLFEKKPVGDDFENINYHYKLGTLFLACKQVDSAVFYFKKMEKQASFIITNSNYNGKTSYSEYVKNYLKGLSISQQGECYLLKKQYSKAIPFIKTVLPLTYEIKEVDQRIINWMSLVEAYNSIGNAQIAFTYLDSIKRNIKSKRMLNLELEIYKQQALTNKIVGNNEVYIRDMQNYFNLKDSIDLENQKNRALLMLADFDLDQKKILLQSEKAKTSNLEIENQNRKKIIIYVSITSMALLLIVFLVYYNYKIQRRAKEILRRNNKKLLLSYQEIELQSNKNEFLLKEIHHRIKNNLQMISSLLSLQKNSLNNEEAEMILNDCKARIKTMALVHQQLYGNEDLDSVLLDSYLKDIIDNTITSYTFNTNFEFQIKAPYSLTIDRAMYLGLIITEILINAIKHNTAANVVFSLIISQVDKKLECIVTENGIGFDLEKKAGFGIKLITILVQQISGVLTIISKKNEGVSYIIVFPDSE